MEPLRWCDWREVCPCGTSRPSRRTLCVSPAGSPARVSRTGATPRPLETASNPRGSAPPRQGGRAEPQPGSKPDPLLKGRSAQTPPAEWAPFDQASGRGSCWGSSKPGSAARPPGRPPGRGVSLEAWRRGSRRRIPPRARRPRLRPHIAMRNSRSGRPAFRAHLVGALFSFLRLPAVGVQPSRKTRTSRPCPPPDSLGVSPSRCWRRRALGRAPSLWGRVPQLPRRRRGGTVARRTRPAHPFGCPPPCVRALHYPTRAPSPSLRGDRRRHARRRPPESRPWPGRAVDPPPPGVKRRRRSTRPG